MASTEIEFSPFLSLAAIATGACQETIVSDSADLRAESQPSGDNSGVYPRGPE